MAQRDGQMIAYEALLTQRENLAKVQAERRRIEQIGGAIKIEQSGGAIIVTLLLPAPYTPQQFYPDLPFFSF